MQIYVYKKQQQQQDTSNILNKGNEKALVAKW